MNIDDNISKNTPTPDKLVLGEIAMSCTPGEEALFIKNTQDEVIPFSPHTYTKEEIKALLETKQDKLKNYHEDGNNVTISCEDTKMPQCKISIDKHTLHMGSYGTGGVVNTEFYTNNSVPGEIGMVSRLYDNEWSIKVKNGGVYANDKKVATVDDVSAVKTKVDEIESVLNERTSEDSTLTINTLNAQYINCNDTMTVTGDLLEVENVGINANVSGNIDLKAREQVQIIKGEDTQQTYIKTYSEHGFFGDTEGITIGTQNGDDNLAQITIESKKHQHGGDNSIDLEAKTVWLNDDEGTSFGIGSKTIQGYNENEEVLWIDSESAWLEHTKEVGLWCPEGKVSLEGKEISITDLWEHDGLSGSTCEISLKDHTTKIKADSVLISNKFDGESDTNLHAFAIQKGATDNDAILILRNTNEEGNPEDGTLLLQNNESYIGLESDAINIWNENNNGQINFWAPSVKINDVEFGNGLKTINGQSILGSGNIEIKGGAGEDVYSKEETNALLDAKQDKLTNTSEIEVKSIRGNNQLNLISDNTVISDRIGNNLIKTISKTDIEGTTLTVDISAQNVNISASTATKLVTDKLDITNVSTIQGIKTINNESILGHGNININTDWDSIANKPIPLSGNATPTEVVMGNDTRLTDARNANDVYAWAKQSTKPTYNKAEIGLNNVDNTSDINKPISNATRQTITTQDDKIANAIGLVVTSTSEYNDYSYASNNPLLAECHTAGQAIDYLANQLKQCYDVIAQLKSNIYMLEADVQVTPNETLTQENIKYVLTHDGQFTQPSELTITKIVNDGEPVVIYDQPQYSAVLNSDITGAKEYFCLLAKPDQNIGVPIKVEFYRYLCAIGTSTNNTIDVSMMDGFTKYISDGTNCNKTVSTNNGEYIWIVVPYQLNVVSVLCEGITFPLTTPQEVIMSKGVYKAYRSLQQLAIADWNLTINLLK